MGLNKKYKYFLCVTAFAALFALTAFAADTQKVWHWKGMPQFKLLPYLVIGCVIIETLVIYFVPKLKKFHKVFGAVAVGNAFSFAMPYLVAAVQNAKMPTVTLWDMLENQPIYTVALPFIVFTFLVECTFEYYITKPLVEETKPLLITIYSTNAASILICAVVERLVCRGGYI